MYEDSVKLAEAAEEERKQAKKTYEEEFHALRKEYESKVSWPGLQQYDCFVCVVSKPLAVEHRIFFNFYFMIVYNALFVSSSFIHHCKLQFKLETLNTHEMWDKN